MNRYRPRPNRPHSIDTSDPGPPKNDPYSSKKILPPLGKGDDISFETNKNLIDILRRPIKYYAQTFIEYFVNDTHSVQQCLNLLSIKPSNEKSLLKALPSNTYRSSNHTGRPGLDERYDSLFFNDSNHNLNNSKHNSSHNHSPLDSGTKANLEDLSQTHKDIIGSSQLSEICKSLDDELHGHYYKANIFQGFVLDVTMLMLRCPELGFQMMLAPEILLIILDAVIVPYFFTSLESAYKNNKGSDVYSLMENIKDIPTEVSERLNDDVQQHVYESFVKQSNHIYKQIYNDENNPSKFTFQIKTRLKNIPATRDVIKDSINDISDEDFGKLIIISLVVVLTGTLSVIEEECEYICKKCCKPFISKCKPESYTYTSIYSCPNFIEGTHNTQRCDGRVFSRGEYLLQSDYQELRCQSLFKTEANISNVNYIPVVVRREIAGRCYPGDTIHITGFVRRRWNRIKVGERLECELFIDANNIDVTKPVSTTCLKMFSYCLDYLYDKYWDEYRDNEIAARNEILKAMVPSLINLDNAKLGLILTLIGGFNPDGGMAAKHNRWAKFTSEGSNKKYDTQELLKEALNKNKGTRTQCHILFVGDPGTGKSQLLNYAGQLSEKHVSVIGTNLTSVGLTCTLVRNGPDTMLAGGALVMASGGICCIDEFTAIKKEDKACLHEAMEQQMISIAKSGIKCTLNCQCSIIAASNFHMEKTKGGKRQRPEMIDENRIMNVKAPLPLLTRFDLIIVFRDTTADDLTMCDFFLGEREIKMAVEQNLERVDWKRENTLKHYIQFVRSNKYPELTSSCKFLIDRYYKELKNISFETDFGGGPTVRTIESIVRLSQAHARLMFRDKITVFDVVSVIFLMEFGLQGLAIGCKNGTEQVLDRIGLFDDIKELFEDYVKNNSSNWDENELLDKRLTNGIKDQQTYDYFEKILFDKLNIKRSSLDKEELKLKI